MSCRTSCCKTFVFVLAVLALAMVAVPAFAAGSTTPCPPGASCNCIQNEFNIEQGANPQSTASSNSLVCTANDVQIAQISNVRNPSTGGQLTSCNEGAPFDFIADFEIVTTSQSSRSNIGLYIAKSGITVADALSVTNSCADNIIPAPAGFVNTNTTGKTPTVGANGLFNCGAPDAALLCGTDYYDELDQAPPADNCGDTSSSDDGLVTLCNPATGVCTGPTATAGAQQVTLYIQGFQCPTTTVGLPTCTVNGVTGPCAVLPNCTSWQVPGKQLDCIAPTGKQSYSCTGAMSSCPAAPGDKSKCNCETIIFPILVQKPSATVSKACTTALTAQNTTGCDSGTEGEDEVTYTITITNTSNFGTLTLTSVTDSVYGTILGTGTFTGDTNNGCSSTSIAANSSVTCTFEAHKYGDPGTGAGQATVTDTASAAGTSGGGNWGPTTSNSVTVTPDEAPALATVVKGLGSPNLTAGCATANFTVDVKNTSNTTATIAGTCNTNVTPNVCSTGKVGASCTVNAGCNVSVTLDETETLTALSDSAYSGIATGTGQTVGAGVLSTTCAVPQTIGAGSDYSCGFSAQFCGTLGSVEEYGTGTCDTVTTLKCTAGNVGAACSKNADCDLFCNGLSHTNSITATINGDEGGSDTVSPTTNTLHTSVCLNPFTQ